MNKILTLLSVSILFQDLYANEYIRAIIDENDERIEELNEGYEGEDINLVSQKYKMTAIQYASKYKPEYVQNLLSSYDLNLNVKKGNDTPLNILASSILSNNNSENVKINKAMIYILNKLSMSNTSNYDKYFRNKDSKTKLDFVQTLIKEKNHMVFYYLSQNKIEFDFEKYKYFTYKTNPVMNFYLPNFIDKKMKRKSLIKLIKQNEIEDIKKLLNDDKLSNLYKELIMYSVIYKKTKIFKIAKEYMGKTKYNNYYRLAKLEINIENEKVKQDENKETKKTKSKAELETLKRTKIEYEEKLLLYEKQISLEKKQRKQEIELLAYKIKEKIDRKNRLEINKIINKYDKKLEKLRIEYDKKINKFQESKEKALEQKELEQIEITNLKLKTKDSEVLLIKEKLSIKDSLIAKIKKELEILKIKTSKENDNFNILTKEENKKKDNNILIYVSLFLLLISNIYFISKKYIKKEVFKKEKN